MKRVHVCARVRTCVCARALLCLCVCVSLLYLYVQRYTLAAAMTAHNALVLRACGGAIFVQGHPRGGRARSHGDLPPLSVVLNYPDYPASFAKRALFSGESTGESAAMHSHTTSSSSCIAAAGQTRRRRTEGKTFVRVTLVNYVI